MVWIKLFYPIGNDRESYGEGWKRRIRSPRKKGFCFLHPFWRSKEPFYSLAMGILKNL